MPKTLKISLIVVAVLLVIGIIYWYSKNTSDIASQDAAEVSMIDPDEIASSTDTTDAAIDEDMVKMSTQLDGMNTSAADVDASLK